jgi:hypothetical protein
MTARKTITIEVEMSSDVSEASLNEHLNLFIAGMESKCLSMQYDSWHRKINSSWDESHRVEIDISIK